MPDAMRLKFLLPDGQNKDEALRMIEEVSGCQVHQSEPPPGALKSIDPNLVEIIIRIADTQAAAALVEVGIPAIIGFLAGRGVEEVEVDGEQIKTDKK